MSGAIVRAPRRRRWLRWVLWPLGLLVALVAAIAIPIWFEYRSFDAKFEAMVAQTRQDVAIETRERVLGPKAIRITPVRPLPILGHGMDFCLRLADDVRVERDGELNEVNARLMAGAHLKAVLHDSRGKQYTWTHDSWQGAPLGDGNTALDICLSNEYNYEHPPRWERIVAIDLSSDRPLRIHAMRWNSNTTLDAEYDPRPDQWADDPSESWTELERVYGGQPAWKGAPAPSRQVNVRWRGDDYPDTNYNSKLSVLFGESGIQLQPGPATKRMGIVTIPAQDVAVCGLECSGTLAWRVEMLLLRNRFRLQFFKDEAAMDWCWAHRIPFASLAARRESFDHGFELPPRSAYAAQFVDRETYSEHALQSCQWTRIVPETGYDPCAHCERKTPSK